ncbi:class I adenylate-forming enzyme family protein [Hyphococcus luteus]|uniref:2,3-dihydroxybenzoate-AMP ligase n=1 Tax=Hyphococcus luteus TaxID=2058213 RepID=A0A2S7K0D7_9PROT|nr:class I adenylate-forming enzyme family protein [Marinicaulis flavus]PQA85985.1 2,3-dihydroxybenzoate-AMP ligase [Marinicaulis flavus]
MQISPQSRVDDYRRRGWWRDLGVDQLFRAAVADRGDEEALVDPPNRATLIGDAPQRLTFNEVDNRVDRMARAFVKLGVSRGSVVASQLPNIVEGVIAFLACARLGAILSPMATAFRENELRQILPSLEPRVLLTVETFHGCNHATMMKALAEEGVPVGQVLTVGGEGGENTLLDAEREAAEDPLPAVDVDLAEALTICWTSGTEAAPKGVPRHHHHWIVNGESLYEAIGLEAGDTLLSPFPLINIASIGGMVMPWLLCRGRFVQHHPFDLSVFLEQFQKEEIAYTVAPPAVLTMLLKHEDMLAGIDFSGVKCIASGSAPLPPFMVAQWQEKYGVPIMNVFGSNEGCSLFSSAKEVPDPQMRAKYFPRFGAPGVDWKSEFSKKIKTRIVDVETEEEITEPGRPGELRIDGAMTFDGYWKAPELNERAFDSEGYFKTGDLFEIAPVQNGRFYEFVGRTKEIIIRGGVNISPAEIDSLIESHPDVKEAACAAYPDGKLGERVCAFIVLKPGADMSLEELARFLTAKNISVYKLPERLKLVDALPRNAMGKVMRRELSELAG